MRLTTVLPRLLSSLLLALSFAACDLVPIGVSPPPPSAVSSRDAIKAQQLEAVGDFAAAAQAYLLLAEKVKPPLREDYQLSATASLLRAGDVVAARSLVDSIAAKDLDLPLAMRRQLLDGEIALSEGNAQQALVALEKMTQATLPAVVRSQAHLLRAEAYALLGDQVATARERIKLEPLLSDPIAIRDNQNAIMQALATLSDQVLQPLGAQPPDVLSGWADLALIARGSAQDPTEFNRRIVEWRQRYGQHPASEQLLTSLPTFARQIVNPEGLAPLAPGGEEIAIGQPQHIALLLPLSGKLAAVGTAVREGFMAAANAQAGAKPEIRVYDVAGTATGNAAAGVVQVYQQAVQEGADLVVGPLAKESVKVLSGLGALPVPVLALNYRDEGDVPTPNLYQFGLAPEDEARQVAERAWLDGYGRALVLVPEGEWGERVSTAFRKHLEQLGGIVVDQQSYAPEQMDFAKPIRKLLQYSGANQRRQDADYLFMAAFPRQARSILPQLQFFYASGLRVYATSHVYGSKPDPVADQDLEGILFVDMPWVLSNNTPQQAVRQALFSQRPASFSQLQRLYALGVDAYNLTPHLDQLHRSADERFQGETGSLRMDDTNRIHRRLIWARFEGGKARVIDTSTSTSAPQ